MGFSSKLDLVIARIGTWSATPIAWDGLNGAKFVPPKGAAWIRPTIRGAGARRAGVGTPTRRRHTDVLIVQVFTPPGTGDTEATDLADQVADLFRDYVAEGAGHKLIFREPEGRPVGIDPQGYYQFNVESEFQWDEVL